MARLLPPEGSSVEHVSREVGVSITTLERKRQPLAAYRFGGLECMLLGPGEGGLMSMIG